MKTVKLAGFVLALIGVAAAATPALADPPDRSSVTVIGYSEPNDSCGFPMDHVSDLVATDAYFYDSAGNFREYRQTVRIIQATFTNVLTQKSVTMEGGSYTYTYRAGDDYGTIAGRVAVFNAPGAGLITQDAGRIQISGPPTAEILFAAGQHDILTGTFGTICAYLG